MAVPTVTSISPTSGPAAGATRIAITGSNLTTATAVAFAGAAVGGEVSAGYYVSGSQLICMSPSAVADGVVDIIVTNSSGSSTAHSADQFTYTGPPPSTVTGVSPNSGNANGGTTVEITGTGFVANDIQDGIVSFGGYTADSWTVNSDTSITAISPGGPDGAVDVQVSPSTGLWDSSPSSADQFTYAASLPVVTGLGALSGPLSGGLSVAVEGSGFTGAISVSFGGTPGTDLTLYSDTFLTVNSPVNAAGVVDVTVVTPSGTSAITTADEFAYVAAPTVTGVSPNAGTTSGFTIVTITGTGLDGPGFTGYVNVNFGEVGAGTFNIVSDTEIQAVASPASAGTVDVTVQTPGGTSAVSSADQFTYTTTPTSGPVISGISPSSGMIAGGTSVAISGVGFTGVTAVNFGSVSAASFAFNSDTSITAVSPAGSGVVDVTIVTPSGTSAVSSADRFTYDAYTINVYVKTDEYSEKGPIAFSFQADGTTQTLKNYLAGQLGYNSQIRLSTTDQVSNLMMGLITVSPREAK